MPEYDGLEPRGFRIVIDIEPTDLFEVAEPYTRSQALTLPGKVLGVLEPLLPSGWIATAKVKAKVG